MPSGTLRVPSVCPGDPDDAERGNEKGDGVVEIGEVSLFLYDPGADTRASPADPRIEEQWGVIRFPSRPESDARVPRG
jgi:hypothetical protein